MSKYKVWLVFLWSIVSLGVWAPASAQTTQAGPEFPAFSTLLESTESLSNDLFEDYMDTLKGQSIQEWKGQIVELDESILSFIRKDYWAWVDIDVETEPDQQRDAKVYVSKEEYGSLQEGKVLRFSGSLLDSHNTWGFDLEIDKTHIHGQEEPTLEQRISGKMMPRTRNLPRITDINYIGVDDIITIKWPINDAFSDAGITRNARLDAAAILKAIHESGVEYQILNLTGSFTLVDKFGHESESPVVWLTFNRETMESIDWGDETFVNLILHQNVFDIADRFKLHQALETPAE